MRFFYYILHILPIFSLGNTMVMGSGELLQNQKTVRQTSSDPLVTINPKGAYQGDDNQQTFKHPETSISNWSKDFADYSLKHIDLRNWKVETNYLSLSVFKSNDNQWEQQPWETYNQCVTNGYIQDKLNVGLTRDWTVDGPAGSTTSNINNITYQSCDFAAIDVIDDPINTSITVPTYTHDDAQLPADSKSYINHDFYGCKWDFIQEIQGDAFNHTYIEFVMYLAFVNTTNMTPTDIQNFNPSTSSWNSIDHRSITSLIYDGFNPSMKFSTRFGYFFSGYFRTWDDLKGEQDCSSSKWYSNLYDYKNIALYTLDTYFKGYYIDTGVINIIWTDLLTIKYYKGNVICKFNESNLKVWRNDGLRQTGTEWAKALLRFNFVPSFVAENGGSPIANPSCDLNDKPDFSFTDFNVTYWWWDKYFGSPFDAPVSEPFGSAIIEIVNPYDIVNGSPRVMGDVHTKIQTI